MNHTEEYIHDTIKIKSNYLLLNINKNYLLSSNRRVQPEKALQKTIMKQKLVQKFINKY